MENPVLVEVYRGGVLESFHRGVVCVVDRNGEVIYNEGDIQQLCYPRSAMKLLQVLPLLESGAVARFGFTLEEIAVMCGSHNAEPDHLRAVRSILQKIGMDESALLCGPQYPSSKPDANELIRNNLKPQAIHNNCSGKHAGMLALSKMMNTPAENYIDPEHPVQQAIRAVCADMYELPASQLTTALDGCSAPVFALPVYQQAIGYRNLVASEKFSAARQQACATVIEAISAHPFMVAGSKRYCSDLMKITAPRIIGKTGAEGVFNLALTREGWGVCIKIDDGKMLPQYNVAQAFVEATKLFSTEALQPLHAYKQAPVTNFNKLVTGEIRVREDLFSTLPWLD